jgi:hypothetical protein
VSVCSRLPSFHLTSSWWGIFKTTSVFHVEVG